MHESTASAMDNFGRYVRRYEIPHRVYSDKHATYRSQW